MDLFPKSRAARWRFSVLAVLFLLAFVPLAGIPAAGWVRYQPQEGDLIFQSLPHGPLVDAIEGCTGSPYSHCGIVTRRDDGQWVVLEAIGTVHETPLFSWIRRGRRSFFDVYRLKSEHQPRIPEMLAQAREYLGRPYDIHYELDNEKIYCSELIWKAWRDAGGGELGALETLGDMNWQPHRDVIVSIEGRVPLEREMITPRAMAEAKQVENVFSFRAQR